MILRYSSAVRRSLEVVRFCVGTAAPLAMVLLPASLPAQAPHTAAPVRQAAGIGDAADLIPGLAVDKQLGMPDKWWQYKDRAGKPTVYVAEQNWFVSIGGELMVNSGAVVRYRGRIFKTEQEAKDAYRTQFPKPAKRGNVTLTVKPYRAGDEAKELHELALRPDRRPDWLRQETVARYGKAVVVLSAHSNMWALGPKPASGRRRWMAEPVYERIREAALAKWAAYRPK
ncbi:MAG: hypothetical protein NT029_06500 [Armatimonadetes bacterium]|nr:hypothetical protein [Armatimonadota bacterium]